MPEVNLRSIQNGKLIYNLESNYILRKRIMNRILPNRRDILVPIANDFYAPVKLQFPPDMSAGTKYPLVVRVDGASGSQLVKSRYF